MERMMNVVGRRPRPTVTVVTPVYNEEAGLLAWRDAVTRILIGAGEADFRFLLVDDGSTDSSWEKIEQICQESPAFSGLGLSRNFGAHVALSAGIQHAYGDAVATLACDLQDPPEVVLDFVRQWKEGFDIVWGSRRSRQESGPRVLAAKLFEGFLRRYALPRGSLAATGSFLLMDRRVAECFRQFPETNRVTFALVAFTGFRQTRVQYDRRERRTGTSGWSFGRIIKSFYDAAIGFSAVPARLITLLGMGVFVVSVLAIIFLVADYFVRDVQPGWTSLMAATTLFFGIQFMMIGVLAEYLYRIFSESTRRPLYFIWRQAGTVDARHPDQLPGTPHVWTTAAHSHRDRDHAPSVG
jgi:glycosyltransferase involved in cell wall biosynthesis